MRRIGLAALGLLSWSLGDAHAQESPAPASFSHLPVIASSTPLSSSGALPVALGRPVAATMSLDRATPPRMLDPMIRRSAYEAPLAATNDIWKKSPDVVPEPVDETRLPDPVWPASNDEAPPNSVTTLPAFAAQDTGGVRAAPGGSLILESAPTWCGSVIYPNGEPGPGGAPGDRLYAGAEYLLWWTRSPHFPPLVTTSPLTSGGILGAPGTTVLFGDANESQNTRSGGRFYAGYWLDNCHQWAVEGSFFFLGDRSTNFTASSNTFPLLARPFVNLNAGTEFSEITAAPGLATGSVTVRSPSRLWGAEIDMRHPLCCGCNWHVDWLAGFRYLDLKESVDIIESLHSLPTAPAFPNSQITVEDMFTTRNRFYGGQVGAVAEWQRGPWFVNLRGTVALGDTHQVVDINGMQTIVDPAGTVSHFAGGLLALNSNIGHHTRDRFSVVPQIGVNLGYQVTEHWRAYVGYDFLYWTDVLRPGDQIDRGLDVTRIPNFPVPATPLSTPRPAVPFKSTDYWAQGINFGIEFRY